MSLHTTMFESVATLQRPLIGRDSADGVTQTFATVLANMPCSITQASASVRELYAQRNVLIDATVYLPFDPGANVNDLILATRRGNVSETYRVESIFGSDTRGVLFSLGASLVRLPQSLAVPGVPTGLASSNITTTTLTVSWVQGLNAASWNVQRSPSGQSLWTVPTGGTGLLVPTFNDSGLTTGTAYDYRVAAVNDAGASAYSILLTVTTH